MRKLCNCVKASSGIGRATASALAQRGFHVILAGRSLERLEVVRSEIEAGSSSASCQALPVDLCSVPSILSFVQIVKDLFEAHDSPGTFQLLVNNAGTASTLSLCSNFILFHRFFILKISWRGAKKSLEVTYQQLSEAFIEHAQHVSFAFFLKQGFWQRQKGGLKMVLMSWRQAITSDPTF